MPYSVYSRVAHLRQLRGFDDFVRKVMRDWKVNGVAIAVAKDGEIVFSQGFGLRDAAQTLEMTTRSLCPIASMTKTFTSMSLALLADDGLLDWDTPVRQYLPTFKLWDPFASERMTPRDLLTHRSGLPRHDLVWYKSTASRQELFDRLQYLEPTSDFRTIWQYQNLMYMTAGYLVGQLTGTSWEEVVQRRIFDALGMVSSRFSVESMQRAPDFSRGYRKHQRKTVQMPFYEEIEALGPAGSIVSNVDDLSRWLLLNLNKGRHGDRRLVSEGQVAQMHAPQVVISGPGKYPELPQNSYGLGWFVQPYRGRMIIHHGGNIDGFSTMLSLMLEENLGVVVLVNMNATPLQDILPFNVFDRFVEGRQVPWNARLRADYKEIETAGERGKEKAKTDRVPRTRPSHPLDAYAGTYIHPGYGRVHVEKNEKGLRAVYNQLEMSLKHYHYDTFEMRYEPLDFRMLVSFITNARGDVDQLSAPLEPTVKNIVFDRAPDEAMTDRAFLEPFTGVYELMGNAITVSFKEAVLQVSALGMPEYELAPIRGTEFAFKGLSGFTIDFKRDDSGAVTEAIVSMPPGVFIAKKR